MELAFKRDLCYMERDMEDGYVQLKQATFVIGALLNFYMVWVSLFQSFAIYQLILISSGAHYTRTPYYYAKYLN